MAFVERFANDGTTQRKKVDAGTIEDVRAAGSLMMTVDETYELSNAGAETFTVVVRLAADDVARGEVGVDIGPKETAEVSVGANQGLFVWGHGAHDSYLVLNSVP